MLKGLKLLTSVFLLLAILSGCSARPQVLLRPVEAVKVPAPKISPELLRYCPEPMSIPPELQIAATDRASVAEQKMRRVMNIVTVNHESYAICYIRQNGLVDAVKLMKDGG